MEGRLKSQEVKRHLEYEQAYNQIVDLEISSAVHEVFASLRDVETEKYDDVGNEAAAEIGASVFGNATKEMYARAIVEGLGEDEHIETNPQDLRNAFEMMFKENYDRAGHILDQYSTEVNA